MNFQHVQKPKKQHHNKATNFESYILGDKVWLNNKYIKTKQYCKLKAKFFGPFKVLYPVEKQTYKLELPKKSKIYNYFPYITAGVRHHKKSVSRQDHVSNSTRQKQQQGVQN